MKFPVRAISLDLDDTLWPFAPIGERIERTLHDWFVAHCPATAERFPIEEMRNLRERVDQTLGAVTPVDVERHRAAECSARRALRGA